MPRHEKKKKKEHCANSLRNKFALAIKLLYASTAQFRTQACQNVKDGEIHTTVTNGSSREPETNDRSFEHFPESEMDRKDK